MHSKQLSIPLEQAFDLAQQKPHRKPTSEKFLNVTRRYWLDFVAFLRDNHHLKYLHQVKRPHAEAYVAYIRQFGRWDRTICYRPENCPKRTPFRSYEFGGKLSNATLNRYQSVCKCVFNALLADAGIPENPFCHIPSLNKSAVPREIFTSKELQKIFTEAPPLMYGLFMIGLYTGLRLGDTATLKWSEIDRSNEDNFINAEIHCHTHKTGALAEIPVADDLAVFLTKQYRKCGHDKFVLPEAAKLYLEHQNVLNRRIHRFLHSINITTDVAVPGRKRRQSVKDFHSLRHTFCYYAGMRGIPLPVIQRIVGHLSPEMTRHYQDHADREARFCAIKGLGCLTGDPTSFPNDSTPDEKTMRRNLFSYILDAPSEKIWRLWHQLCLPDVSVFSRQR